jgi:predicted nucleic acid-binding protein
MPLRQILMMTSIIEAAVEGLAQFVVTEDKHLLSLKAYESIRIVTPRVFLGLLSHGQSKVV